MREYKDFKKAKKWKKEKKRSDIFRDLDKRFFVLRPCQLSNCGKDQECLPYKKSSWYQHKQKNCRKGSEGITRIFFWQKWKAS
jgi:hypothetical protein